MRRGSVELEIISCACINGSEFSACKMRHGSSRCVYGTTINGVMVAFNIIFFCSSRSLVHSLVRLFFCFLFYSVFQCASLLLVSSIFCKKNVQGMLERGGCTKSVTMRVVDGAVFVILQLLLLPLFIHSIFTLPHTLRALFPLSLPLSWDGFTMEMLMAWYIEIIDSPFANAMSACMLSRHLDAFVRFTGTIF